MNAPRWNGPAVESFAGCAVQPVDLDVLIDAIEARRAVGSRGFLVGHHNLNSLALVQRDADVRAFYGHCDTCYVDGVPVLWLMRIAGLPTQGAVRFSLMDELPALLARAGSRGLSVFHLGGAPETVRRARAWIESRFPALDFGLHHGYFDDDDDVVERINRFRPDLLLVGMGMPKQERWMLRCRDRLDAGALLQAGGTLDYYTGVQPRPPRWMSQAGLGGAYRLARSPARLGRRYLIEPWRLVVPLVKLRRARRG